MNKKALIIGGVVAIILIVVVVVVVLNSSNNKPLAPSQESVIDSAIKPETSPAAPVVEAPAAPVVAAPAAPVVAAPAPLPNKWLPVKNRKQGEDNITWAGRIYDAMVGDPIGTRKAPWEGGINYISGFFGSSSELTKDMAKEACGNPCWWYYNNPGTAQATKDKIDNAGLCDCKNNVPVNFQRIRYN